MYAFVELLVIESFIICASELLYGDFMTSHGFGGARVGSEIKEKEIAEIAQQISKVRGIIWAHVVESSNYNIMFEFAHLHKLEKTPVGLMEEIRKIVEANGKHVHETATWVIQQSYQRGEKKEKKDK